MPHLEHLPYVGFKPTVPVKEAGCLIEPPVSVPKDAMPILAATDAAEPPEEPPGTVIFFLEFFQGFLTAPKKLVSFEEPIANSSLFNFPNKIAPSSHKFLVTVDSYGGTKFSNILLEAVVFISFVQNISFIPNGMPSKALASFVL